MITVVSHCASKLRHHVKYLRTVAATVFFPRPDVDSAVVRLLPRDPQELPPHDEELLVKLIRLGFSQRRKQLRKLLRERVDDWDALSRHVDIDPKGRAEELRYFNGSPWRISSRRHRPRICA